MRSLTTIGYKKALADCKSDNNITNKINVGGAWGTRSRVQQESLANANVKRATAVHV